MCTAKCVIEQTIFKEVIEVRIMKTDRYQNENNKMFVQVHSYKKAGLWKIFPRKDRPGIDYPFRKIITLVLYLENTVQLYQSTFFSFSKSNATLCTVFHNGAVLYKVIHQNVPYQNSNLKVNFYYIPLHLTRYWSL